MLAVVIKFLGRLLRRIFYEVGFKNLGVDAPFLGQHFDSVVSTEPGFAIWLAGLLRMSTFISDSIR